MLILLGAAMAYLFLLQAAKWRDDDGRLFKKCRMEGRYECVCRLAVGTPGCSRVDKGALL